MADETIAHYRIGAKLGEGGMGEVYQATDTKLRREVALKFLPAAFTEDPETLERFRREARALATLSHPNIGAIHGIEESDGRVALVLELIEGDTLADRIAEGTLSRAEALCVAEQVAAALEAAHEQGIVHRDLKPANIKITPEGQAKVLDFGLAKSIQRESAGRSVAESPTLMMTAAQPGMVMGTAPYMSPEQAKGAPVDRRADIWAYGAVLFEMFSGQRLFEGDDATEVLAAVISTEPDLSRLPDDLPAWLRDLVSRCLRRDLSMRLPHMAAARIALQEAGEGRDHAPTLEPRPERRAWVAWAAAMAALLAGLTAGANWLAPESDRPMLRLSIPARLPGSAASSYFAISPDGAIVAHRADPGGSSGLVLRQLDSFDATPVLESDGAVGPFFSPDSRRLAFFAGGRLWAVDVGGGTPRLICDVAQTNSTGLWGSDGYIYFTQWATGTGIYRVPDEGGEAEEFLPLASGDATVRRPRLLPDAAGVSAQTALASGSPSRVYFFDGRPTIPLDRPQVTFLEDGRALFVEAARLFVADYNALTYRIQGVPRLLAKDVLDYRLAANGTIAYRYAEGASDSASANADRRFVRYTREGSKELVAQLSERFANPVISPDGSMIGAHNGDLSKLFVWDVARGAPRPAADGGSYFEWAPDSNTVFFTGRDNDEYFIDRLALDGTAPRERLLTSKLSVWPTDVSTDGTTLLYYVIHPETERDIWMLPLAGSAAPEPAAFLVTDASERSAVFSPDGAWVAYMSDATGREEVYVRPRDRARGGEEIVTVNGGREPRWSPDGSEIYFRLDDGLWAVPVTLEPRFAPGRPELLFTGSFEYEEGGRNQQYDVFPNGDFLMLERLDRPAEIRVVINGLDEVDAPNR